VLVSSELPELMALCDRIAVMSDGRLVATFARGEWTEDGIVTAAFSAYAGRRDRARPH
jgi:ribose transport system ATP-binding protein